jgi:hypothetical protein
MKKFLKISVFLTLIALVFTLLASTVSASDNATIDTGEGETYEYEEDLDFNSVFETVYNTLLENSDKIFSVLAFIASAVIAFLYKKSLMPTVKNSIGTVASALSKFSEESASKIGNASDLISGVNKRLLETENLLSSLSENLKSLEEQLKDKKEDTCRLESIKKVIGAEVDMLYEIFMTSSLPQYKKEEVGERISKMKKELSSEVSENA